MRSTSAEKYEYSYTNGIKQQRVKKTILDFISSSGFVVSNDNEALGRPTSQSGNLTDTSALAVDGNRASNYTLGSCFLTGVTEIPWWLVDLRATKVVTGVFIVNRGDENYRNVTELSIRVGSTERQGGIGNPTCGGLSYSFSRGVARMVQCVPEVEGRFVTIFVPEVNSSFSLCEVEVEISDTGTIISVGLVDYLVA